MSRESDFVEMMFGLGLERSGSATHTQMLNILADALLKTEGPREHTVGPLVELPLFGLKHTHVDREDTLRFMEELDFAVSHFDWTGKQGSTCLIREAIDAMVAN